VYDFIMSIGSQEHASLALDAVKELERLHHDPTFGHIAGEGTWDGDTASWTLTIGDVGLLGTGSSRMVWTIDGDVAYKIGYDGCESDQWAEWDRWVAFHDKMPEGTRLPEMHMYNVNGRSVIAVEVIKFPRQWAPMPNNMPFHFLDYAEYNYRVAPDGTFIPIDFAC
jgi:hypothetical protein